MRAIVPLSSRDLRIEMTFGLELGLVLYDTQAEADARVAWLVDWAHTYKFDPVLVTFTYP